MPTSEPRIIQGGMGAGVSNWVLARAVASLGQLGVVSGTALDTVLVRRLQDGDPLGHVRRAMAAFPVPEIAQTVLRKFWKPAGAGSDNGHKYKLLGLPNARPTTEREDLLILANFVEVHLARQGHSGPVGINYLEKIQMPNLPSLYGAMLAGVFYVLMGAGIPVDMPEIIDRLTQHQSVSTSLDVQERGDQRFDLRFDPARLGLAAAGPLARPKFFPIVSAATLARALLKKAKGAINGFIVEGPIAGGHNAPPRGELKLSPSGEPIYGERDIVDLQQMKDFGLPFYLAGAYNTHEKFQEALALGAQGIQVGTAFAFCEESGLDPVLKHKFLSSILRGQAAVFTDPLASPTGYPFKVAGLEGTISEAKEYADRPRICDLGYLRQPYKKDDGTLGYRCPSEPVDDYLRKGGKVEETVGRKCLCNALMTNIGLGQSQTDGYQELPMLTAGDDLGCVKKFISEGRLSYHAKDVVESLLGTSG